MNAYHGEERRGGENCPEHHMNTLDIKAATVDIASIKSGLLIGRWVVGILVAVGALIIGGTLTEIKTAISEVKTDIKFMIPTEARLNRLEKTVDYNSGRLLDIEKKLHSHNGDGP